MLIELVFLAADWSSLSTSLAPGQRVAVQRQGTIEQGLFAYSRTDELVLTTNGEAQLRIPKEQVEIVTARGTESPKLRFWANVHDQLLPKPVVVYQREGAVPITARKRP